MISTGASFGLTFRMVGGAGRSVGSWPPAALIAACTSSAAPSRLRDSSNCSTTDVLPSELVEVISVTPGIRENWRSSGVATVEAIVSGLAPGSDAPTDSVGKSISGTAETGKYIYATIPIIRIAAASSEVATGRVMKGAEMFTVVPPGFAYQDLVAGEARCTGACIARVVGSRLSLAIAGPPPTAARTLTRLPGLRLI